MKSEGDMEEFLLMTDPKTMRPYLMSERNVDLSKMEVCNNNYDIVAFLDYRFGMRSLAE